MYDLKSRTYLVRLNTLLTRVSRISPSTAVVGLALDVKYATTVVWFITLGKHVIVYLVNNSLGMPYLLICTVHDLIISSLQVTPNV